MKFSRVFLSIFLAALMLFPLSSAFAVTADEETAETETETEVDLPTSFTLVGTDDLPPISNQGVIGSCSSQAITYTQMTNAVSRYIHSINPDSEWNPSSGNTKYIMSSKFTYDFSGAGTAWVYDVLVSQGCATMDMTAFYPGTAQGGYKIFKNTAIKLPYLESTRWTVKENEMLTALNYRLTNYDQIWVRDISADNGSGKKSFTTTTGGKEFINKIKSALVEGNVVVTGGLSGGWQYEKLLLPGSLSKSGDYAITWCNADGKGGHQVSIVGYDDEAVFNYSGGELKGAFLVANSWAEDWMNDGYVWLMYDAMNEVSEYDSFNALHPNRTYAMDQYIFTYWDEDIVIGAPELSVQVELECVNREGTAVYLARRDGNNTVNEIPAIFKYGMIGKNVHPDYDASGESFTFSGQVITGKTKAEVAYFTFCYNDLLKSIEEGKTFNDYEWGVYVYSVNKEEILIKSIKLINSLGDTLDEIELPEGGQIHVAPNTTSSAKYFFEYKKPSVTLEQTSGFTFEYLTGSAEYQNIGNEISFKVSPEEGKTIETVTLNDEVLNPVDGVYTFTVSETNNIKVTTLDDEPTATVTPDITLPSTSSDATETPEDDDNGSTVILIIVAAVIVVAVVAVVAISAKKKKQ